MRRIALIATTLIAVAGLPATSASAAPVGQTSTTSSTGLAHPQLTCDLAPFLPGCGLPNFPF